MEYLDCYATLGVDVKPGNRLAEDRFKQINQAYGPRAAHALSQAAGHGGKRWL